MAEKNDVFDLLAYVACASETKTRVARAEQGAAVIEGQYDPKLAAFLNYVLGQYLEAGVQGLDRSNLPDYLRLRYGTFADGTRNLGGVDTVLKSFVAFQKYLYE